MHVNDGNLVSYSATTYIRFCVFNLYFFHAYVSAAHSGPLVFELEETENGVKTQIIALLLNTAQS